MAELATGIALLGLILAGLAVSMHGFTRFNEYQWARQRCIAAAQAQLDSITATGRPVGPEEMKRVWSNVEVSVNTTPGTGPWDGLELVQVTATAQPGPKPVTVRLGRYVNPKRVVAKGE